MTRGEDEDLCGGLDEMAKTLNLFLNISSSGRPVGAVRLHS